MPADPKGYAPTADLEALLRILNDPSSSAQLPESVLTKHDLDLVSSGLLKGSPVQARSLAYVILGKAFEPDPTGSPDALTSLLKSYASSLLSETSSPSPVLSALALLKALLEVSSDAGKSVLSEEGTLETIMDMAELDFFSTAINAKTGVSDQARVRLAIVEMLNTGCSVPGLRGLIKARAEGWLTSQADARLRNDGSDGKGSLKESLAEEMAVISAVALTKLSRASNADPLLESTGQPPDVDPDVKTASPTSGSNGTEAEQERLSAMLSRVVISSFSSSISKTESSLETTTSAIEGLVYTSLGPAVREHLSLDRAFLESLYELASQTQPTSGSTPSSSNGTTTQAPRKSGLSPSYSLDLSTGEDLKSTSLAYGISVILLNIVSRKALLSEEERQVEKLKKMAGRGTKTAGGKLGSDSKQDKGPGGAGQSDEEDHRLSNEAVGLRVKRVLTAGAMKTIGELSKTKSTRVKEVVGKLLLELVWEKEDRLEVIQGGGAKILLSIVATLLGDAGLPKKPKPGSGEEDVAYTGSLDRGAEKGSPPLLMSSIQALAKLIITTPPLNLFGQTYTSAALDCVRPLAHLLQHPSSSLLQRFESLMALTNLASISPEVASRIMAQGEDFMRKVESEMLEHHELVRRAAVELVCNLATSEEGFCWYTGENPGTLWDGADASKLTDAQRGKRKTAKNRLRILLAMTDVNDLPTRLAAAGGLASLVQSQIACESLLSLDGNSGKAWERIVLMLRPGSGGHDSADEEEETLEISTAPPNEGLVHRALVIAVDLLTYASGLPPNERRAILNKAVQCELLQELLGLLAGWTAQEPAVRVVAAKKELVDATVECLRLMRDGGIDLTA